MKTKKQSLKDLETLFAFVPPERLNGSVTALLLQSLMAGNPPDKEAAEDIYFLFEFLDKQK